MADVGIMGVCISAAHDVIREDDEKWGACTYVGIQEGFGQDVDYELRNCAEPGCRSTLMRPIAKVVRSPDRTDR